MSTCRSCEADIVWARTAKGKLAPFNAAPDPEGLWVIEHGDVRQAGMLDEGPRYTSHFATCPAAALHHKS